MVEEERMNLIAVVKILQEKEFEGDTNKCKAWVNACEKKTA